MSEFIYENRVSIPNTLCDEIIDLFEDQDDKSNGCTLSGVNKNIKDTTDYVIPHSKTELCKWFKIEQFLYKELNSNLKKYINIIDKPCYKPSYSMFKDLTLETDNFMIQKYNKCEGKYEFHNDSRFQSDEKKYRVITFLWYLNTIEEGGETQFWDNLLVKPEQGKLILFPATWSYPHRGKVPLSDNKYIITGWLNINV